MSASAPRVFKLDNRVKSLKVADTPDTITLDALRYHFEVSLTVIQVLSKYRS